MIKTWDDSASALSFLKPHPTNQDEVIDAFATLHDTQVEKGGGGRGRREEEEEEEEEGEGLVVIWV